MNSPTETCAICKITSATSSHHLTPKSKGGKETIELCQFCHDKIHSFFSCAELENGYNTLDSLISHPEIAKHIAWRQKHPNFVGTFKMANVRKKKGNKYK